MLKEETPVKLLRMAAVPAMACFAALLFPQTQVFIVSLVEKIAGKSVDSAAWSGIVLEHSLTGFFSAGAFLIISTAKLRDRLDKHVKKYLVHGSILIIAASVVIRVIMYVKCRSLWMDEATLAGHIVNRGWFELLAAPPLNVSSPVLYVLTVKAAGFVFGYSEFSLRVFSLFAFLGLLACGYALLKKALNFDNRKTAFVLVAGALLPAYFWYSNELKPYMGDALFAFLAILLYFYYRQGKFKLPALTAFYILLLGFSYPSLFFAGGALLCEFLAAAFNRDKKRALSVIASGTAIAAVFALYYSWWMSPVAEPLIRHWDDNNRALRTITQIRNIFSPWVGNSNSACLWYLVPLALPGIFASVRSRDKTACSVALSLILACLASSAGMWPLTGRLWLFLPAFVLVYTPPGLDFITGRSKTGGRIGTALLWGIIAYLSINSLGYAGNKMYFKSAEANPLISYVQKNIKDGEKLYLYQYAEWTFDYRNGYSARIGDVTADNIIYGGNWEEWAREEVGAELRSILENEKTYLLFQHGEGGGRSIDGGLAALRNHGTLTRVMEVHSTPLYYFEKPEGEPWGAREPEQPEGPR